MLESYVQRVLEIAKDAGSEAKLEGELNHLLKELLSNFGIPYNPVVNETLKSQGFSQVNSERPDSLFGHVVLDYKKPGVLESATQTERHKVQIERYLDTITKGRHQAPALCEKWAGVLWDGYHILFCHSDGNQWQWTKSYEMSEYSLLTLVQTYRSLNREPLSANRLSYHFGKNSKTAQKVLPVICHHLANPKHRTTLLFREWKRLFEQVSTYSLSQLPSLKTWARNNKIMTNDAAQILFALHTYYSIIVKLLTSELLSSVNSLSDSSLVADIANAASIEVIHEKIQQLENGDFYQNYRISNFLEGDFFSWYTKENSQDLAESFVEIAKTFQLFEPATAKLKPEGVQDLLKQFYSSLVDEQIRHDLGEYYTPDWLAQHVLTQVGYDGNVSKTVLDPACGSGTFLVECIIKLRKECEKQGFSQLYTLKTILHNIKGLDLNPLAVISARANYILTISDLVFNMGDDIEIPIYLADAINVPVETDDGTIEYILDTEIDEYTFRFPIPLIKNQLIGRILLKCEDFISRARTSEQLINALKRDHEINPFVDELAEQCICYFYDTIYALNTRKPPWDSIWCRIVKNNFSPKGFGRVDYIVGNPPWVRWSRLPSTYRNRVKSFCHKYGLVSGKRYTGGIESDISTVLVFSAADNWLQENGKIGVLITWTVFKSGSARGFRVGKLPDGSGIKMELIEDLTRIQPFPDASNETAIYIARKVKSFANAIFDEVECLTWKPMNSSRISPYLRLPEVLSSVHIDEETACPISDFGSPLFTGGKAIFDSVKPLRGISEYLEHAHRGTVNDLARVYWVKVEKYSPETNRALIRTLRENELAKARRVKPVEGAWIEADLLYPLLRGRETGRYAVKTAGWYQIVPNDHYANIIDEDEFSERFPLTYSYLMRFQELLPTRSTYRRYMSKLPPYSVYCVGDYTFLPYKVVWPEQQNPNSFRASVVSSLSEDTIIPNKVIIPDHKLYFVGSSNQEEAHYLCAFINSGLARNWLGGFLLGKQIGTTIFEFMNVPTFNPQNEIHQKLMRISMDAHEARRGTRDVHPLRKSLEEEINSLVRKSLEG